MALAPPTVVEGVSAVAPLHSLLTAAVDVPSNGDDRWQLGFCWEPEACVEAGLWDPDCPPVGEDTNEKCPPAGWPDEVCYEPYYVHLPSQPCIPIDRARTTAKLRRQMDAATPRAVEHEFWTGRLKPTNPHLAQNNPGDGLDPAVDLTPTPGEPASARFALAALTQGLANCSATGRGMIHAPPMLVTSWIYQGGVIESDKGRLQTRVGGHLVVPGSGYPGTGPGGVAPPDGATYAYGTAMVQVRLGDVTIIDAEDGAVLNRKTNEFVLTAERMAAATFDPCCHVTILSGAC